MFSNCTNHEQIRIEFKRLAMKNHPDRGGSTETMQAINDAYLKACKAIEYEEEDKNTLTSDRELAAVINKLMKFNGLEIELIGSWLYVSGNTKEIAKELKEIGLVARKRRDTGWRWIYMGCIAGKSFGRMTMDDIRHKHGSQTILTTKQLH